MKSVVAIIIILLTTNVTRAQEFRAESRISGVTREGFYQIPLKPEVSAFANSDFSNIRLFDEKSIEIPYVLGTYQARQTGTTFQKYRIEQRTILKDSCTILVLSNPGKTTINNISLIIKNATITKDATLAGSDDKETWYALKDEFRLGSIDNPNGTSEVQIVDFPNSNYAYYRLITNDKENLPLNILDAGYYTSFSEEAKYYSVPTKQLQQTNDTDKKKSYIRIRFDTLQFIDRVNWTITGAPFYLREATLYIEKQRTNRKGKTESYLEYLSDVQLNSHHQNIVFLSNVKTDNLLLEISNEDNPPLVVSDVAASQVARHLTAWLRPAGDYKLKFGTTDMIAPVYDLAYFRDSIPADPFVLNVGKVIQLKSDLTQQAESTLFTNQYFIWSAILVVGLILAFMSVKMVRETNTESK